MNSPVLSCAMTRGILEMAHYNHKGGDSCVKFQYCYSDKKIYFVQSIQSVLSFIFKISNLCN